MQIVSLTLEITGGGGDLTLEQTLTTARAFEQSQQQATGFERGRNSESFVNKV